ncbi:MAG: M3 family oligoendopeptidase [Phycisphaeraceae bacterium]|nr:M3 family oligoendopeptidase [Phycisphaeraceae bacterium]
MKQRHRSSTITLHHGTSPTEATDEMHTHAGTDFVPMSLNGSDLSQVLPLIEDLLNRPIDSEEAFDRWLLDRSELDAALSEAAANLYISMTCDTADTAKADAYTRYIETVPPAIKPLAFRLDQRHVALVERFPRIDPARASRYAVLDRDTRAEVEIFREANVPIQTELEKLAQQYQTTIGAMTVVFDGQERTLPQMGVYQESTDRSVRESAWRTVAARRLIDADTIDSIYDQQVALRHQMARNAGCASFTEYAFKAMRRFDYTPDHCLDFHAACEEVVVPLVDELDEQRASLLGLPALRPWDLAVDPRGRQPLRPFNGGRELVAKSVACFHSLDPRLAEMLSSLGDGSEARGSEGGANFDLDSRKGKAPGGYQYNRDRSRIPFIFMNAAGLQRDAETMLHEAGHAFHSLLSRDEPLMRYREAPIEFAEVASMSMELLTQPHWGAFYPDEESRARAVRQHLQGVISILPWIATIDAFQHWVYANPSHSHDDRREAWLSLDDRFGRTISWAGLDETRATVWHRQPHPFSSPFYYIEYGIAQLGALQLWLHSIEKGPRDAVDAYIRAMSLGGSRPLPDLFAAAGLTFDFSPKTVTRLVERLARELEKLPA